MDRGSHLAGAGGHLFFAPPLPSPTGFQPVALAMHRESREGGRRVEKAPMAHGVLSRVTDSRPAVLAATGPRWQVPHTTRPLIVVLDDSQSLLAGPEGERPRDRAIEKLEELTKERRFRSFQLIAAGTTPRLLGDKARHLRELEDQFEQWTCQAPQARLNAALGLARAMGHQEADLLVLTDEAPLARPAKGIYAGSPSASPALILPSSMPPGLCMEPKIACCWRSIASALTGTNTLRVVAGTNVLPGNTHVGHEQDTSADVSNCRAYTQITGHARARCPCRR